MPLTTVQLARYAQDGYLVVEGLISPHDLVTLRERIDEVQATVAEAQAAATASRRDRATNGPSHRLEQAGSGVGFMSEGGGTATATRPALRKLAELAPHDEFFRSVAGNPALLEAVRALTGGGPHILLYSDQVFLKPAFCGSEKPLHQDNSYFKVSPNSAGVTCWLALDDATVENGCMHYIPGSHKLGLVPHKAIKDTPHLIPDVDFKLDAEVPVPIPAGACIFHHLLCLHSSKANTSPKSRRAWALHYANRAAESCVKPWEKMLKLS